MDARVGKRLTDSEVPFVGAMSVVGDTHEVCMTHEEIDASHSPAFLLIVARASHPPVTALVGVNGLTLVVWAREHAEFGTANSRAQCTVHSLDDFSNGDECVVRSRDSDRPGQIRGFDTYGWNGRVGCGFAQRVWGKRMTVTRDGGRAIS